MAGFPIESGITPPCHIDRREISKIPHFVREKDFSLRVEVTRLYNSAR